MRSVTRRGNLHTARRTRNPKVAGTSSYKLRPRSPPHVIVLPSHTRCTVHVLHGDLAQPTQSVKRLAVYRTACPTPMQRIVTCAAAGRCVSQDEARLCAASCSGAHLAAA
eukprot:4018456-Prymnesium_polylepis.1